MIDLGKNKMIYIFNFEIILIEEFINHHRPKPHIAVAGHRLQAQKSLLVCVKYFLSNRHFCATGVNTDKVELCSIRK